MEASYVSASSLVQIIVWKYLAINQRHSTYPQWERMERSYLARKPEASCLFFSEYGLPMMLGVVGYVAAAVGCIHTNILSILISFMEIVILLWILSIEKNSGEFINDRVLHFLFVLLCFWRKIGSGTQTIMELKKLLFHHPQCSYSRCI